MLSEMWCGDKMRDDIFRKIEDIKSLLVKLKNHSDDDFTAGMKAALNDAYERLKACEMECRSMADQFRVVQFAKSGYNFHTLKLLQTELSHIHDNLENQVLCAISEQLFAVKQQMKKGNEEIKRDIVYPQAGVYPVKAGVLKPPAKVSKPVFEIEGEQMIVSWEDDDNPPGSIIKYELSLNTKKALPVNDATCKRLSIGRPQVEPGVIYTLQVRGINGRGPGEWSEARTAHYKTAPPNRPKKPKVSPGYTDATIHVLVPDIKEANGAPVSRIIVQYCEYDNSSRWSFESFHTKQQESQHSCTVTVCDLSPYTRYFFRIVLVNEYGRSAPSESAEATTILPIPGKPTDVRQSSHYTSSVLKIRWNPPEENAQFVDHYEVEYKKKKKEFDKRHKFDVIVTAKLSATAKELSSDTKYAFYVRAVNKNGECSEKVRIEAETSWKKAAKAALSPLVFLGGTVGGPVLVTAAGALAAGSLSLESRDSKAGAVGAGVAGGIGGALLGTVGAPFVGGAMAHYFVHGFGPDSEQSDDD